jgi:hypothetical protein
MRTAKKVRRKTMTMIMTLMTTMTLVVPTRIDPMIRMKMKHRSRSQRSL